MLKIKAVPLALNAATQDKNSNNLILKDKGCLHETGHIYQHVDSEHENSLCLIHQIGLENYFFYSAQLYEKRFCKFTEHGIGILSISDNGVILERLYPIEHIHQNGAVFTDSHYDFGDSLISVGSFMPVQEEVKYFLQNSIVTSDGVFCLEPGEFLYVDDKGELKGATSEDITEIIRKNKKGVQVGTTKPRKPKMGTIILNKATGKFEGYNGKEWLEL